MDSFEKKLKIFSIGKNHQSYVPHFDSSLLSPQSSTPSHCHDGAMHRPLSHLNEPVQQVSSELSSQSRRPLHNKVWFRHRPSSHRNVPSLQAKKCENMLKWSLQNTEQILNCFRSANQRSERFVGSKDFIYSDLLELHTVANSSVPSMQSASPLHFKSAGIHWWVLRHWNFSGGHREGVIGTAGIWTKKKFSTPERWNKFLQWWMENRL
jgi:hypothetical protein